MPQDVETEVTPVVPRRADPPEPGSAPTAGSGEVSVNQDGELSWVYTLSPHLKALNDVQVHFVDGRVEIGANCLKLIEHVIQATPTKKDDTAYGVVEGFLDQGIKLLAFQKALEHVNNGHLELKNDGQFLFTCQIPDHLSVLHNVRLNFQDGVLKSNADLFGLIEAGVKATPTNLDNKGWDMAKGLVKLALLKFAFKKKLPPA